MESSDVLPRLRPVETFPMEMDGRASICLRDPLGYATGTVAVSYPAFFILSKFDGKNTIVDIQAGFMQQFGELLRAEQIRELITQLDAVFLLETEGFRERRAQVRQEFSRLSAREPAHAGTAYPGEAVEIGNAFSGYFHEARQSAGDAEPEGSDCGALVAPHIDIRHGGVCMARAYEELRRAGGADLFLILGTAHGDAQEFYSLCRKDFRTPLGTAQTDQAFCQRLVDRYSSRLVADEYAHKDEHSVEFQVVFLQHLFGAERPVGIVPILCGSLHEAILKGVEPDELGGVGDFLAVLGEAIREDGRKICLIAGADLSHVGPRFGDTQKLSDRVARWVEKEDREMLDPVVRGDAAGFYAHILKVRDRRRICGFPPIYALLHLGNGKPGRLLAYDKYMDTSIQSLVSYASVAFP